LSCEKAVIFVSYGCFFCVAKEFSRASIRAENENNNNNASRPTAVGCISDTNNAQKAESISRLNLAKMKVRRGSNEREKSQMATKKAGEKRKSTKKTSQRKSFYLSMRAFHWPIYSALFSTRDSRVCQFSHMLYNSRDYPMIKRKMTIWHALFN